MFFLFFFRRQLKSYDDAEDARLEEGRRQALEIMEKKREQEWAKRQQYAQCILQQIQLNEEKRLQQIQLTQKVVNFDFTSRHNSKKRLS